MKETIAFNNSKLVQEKSLNAIDSLNQGICSMIYGGRSVFIR